MLARSGDGCIGSQYSLPHGHQKHSLSAQKCPDEDLQTYLGASRPFWQVLISVLQSPDAERCSHGLTREGGRQL